MIPLWAPPGRAGIQVEKRAARAISQLQHGIGENRAVLL